MTKQEIRDKIQEFKSEEEIVEFVKSRIEELEQSSKETMVSPEYMDTFDDFLSSKVHYKLLDPKRCPDLVYDDIKPYIELIAKLSAEKSYFNEMYLFGPLMHLIFNYMSRKENRDNPYDNLVERTLLYVNAANRGEKSISIKEFNKGKYALCFENAGLAHNIFKILGIDSQIVFGKVDEEPHAFNFVFPKGYGNNPVVLFEPSFCLDYVDEKEQNISMGLFKVLTEEEYNAMFNKGGTYIDFKSSAETLMKYFSQLNGLTPKYKNAVYSIGGVPKLEKKDEPIK